jgi:hypothetical protein
VLLIIIGLILALLFWASPNARHGFQWVSPGGFIAVVLWLVAAALFAVYVANFSHYNKVYGSLGGVIIFLVWMWISNVAILLGAEFNAELERGRAVAGGHLGDALHETDDGSLQVGQVCHARPFAMDQWCGRRPRPPGSACRGRARREAAVAYSNPSRFYSHCRESTRFVNDIRDRRRPACVITVPSTHLAGRGGPRGSWSRRFSAYCAGRASR